MSPQFPNHFLPFPMVFLHVSPSVSMTFLGVSTVFPSVLPPFPILDFADYTHKLAQLEETIWHISEKLFHKLKESEN